MAAASHAPSPSCMRTRWRVRLDGGSERWEGAGRCRPRQGHQTMRASGSESLTRSVGRDGTLLGRW